MTGYFDDKRRAISQAARELEDTLFVDFIEGVERQMIHEVSLLTGDREFPEDLREKMQSVIANFQITVPKDSTAALWKPRRYALAMKESDLVERLHSLFHELAGRRLRTRHGLLLDSPIGFLRERGDLVEEVPPLDEEEETP